MKLLWSLLRPLLFMLDAERAHHFAMGVFATLSRVPGVRGLFRALFTVRDPRLRTDVAGLRLPNPVGLAAGFDKDADWFDALHALGFGYVEVGTLTAHAQAGNPQPRLFRLPADRALINRMGFNNRGSENAAKAFARRRANHSELVLGINIGKSKITPNEDAIADYLTSFDRLRRYAHYVVVNVSSPNTQGLRDLQETAALRALLGALLERGREESQRKPLFVKIAPDMTDEQAAEIVELAAELGLDGIIATNTTVSRASLATPGVEVEGIGNGGLSGAPLTVRSRRFVARLYRASNGKVPIIGVGGIMNGDDAWDMLRAGASAVQIYTGFIYGGPTIVRDINRRLLERLEASEFDTIPQVVGTAADVFASA